MDMGIYLQDRWSLGRVTLSMGLRYDQFIGETREGEVLPNRINSGFKYAECSDGMNNPKAGCAGQVQNWKDLSPRVGMAWDVFGNGRTAVKASAARYVAGQQIAVANALSDVYAMGGKPLTAMNVVCFPIKTLDISVLREILTGGLEKMREADVVLVPGKATKFAPSKM